MRTEYAAGVVDVNRLRETRRDRQSSFAKAGYIVICSDYSSGLLDGSGKRGWRGVGLAVKESMVPEQCANPTSLVRAPAEGEG